MVRRREGQEPQGGDGAHFKSDGDSPQDAIVVNMWLIGFDVSFPATIYMYKPMRRTQLHADHRPCQPCVPRQGGALIVDYIDIADT